MLRAIEQLLNGERTVVGNHRCETSNESGHEIEKYYYHSTAICTVDRNIQIFTTDNGGWGTSSTSRAINDYRDFFIKHCGYCEVFAYFKDVVEQLIEVPMDSQYRCCYGSLDSAHTEVTIRKRMLGLEKFAEINVSKDNEDFSHTYEIKYKGPKTLEEAIRNQIWHLFPQ